MYSPLFLKSKWDARTRAKPLLRTMQGKRVLRTTSSAPTRVLTSTVVLPPRTAMTQGAHQIALLTTPRKRAHPFSAARPQITALQPFQ